MFIDQLGKKKRLEKIFCKQNRGIIVPVDDLLIFGPKGHLSDFEAKIPLLKDSSITAILGYPGVFRQFYDDLKNKSWILNLTVSTINADHTNKKLALTLEYALSLGADAVAVHVNVSSPSESDMIVNLCKVSSECNVYGLPLLAIMYARKPGVNGDDNYIDLKEKDEEAYTNLLAHTCRIAAEIGVDIIKTTYTGKTETFRKVIQSAGGIPVVVAGGEIKSEEKVLAMASGAIKAGASGICFGRNTLSRKNITEFIKLLSEIVYGRVSIKG